jgi:NAD(P)-dependent dehydrogenase (short-subunit alcohol dehydrogenase family)
VVVADLNAEQATETAEGIRAAGGQALAQRTDIGDPASIDTMVEACVAEFGALHVLFNNAADTSPGTLARDGLIADMEIDLWDHVMAVDLRGAMWCSKRAIPHIAAAGGGSIINTSSNQALAGDMSQSAYAIAKAGIDHLSRYTATQCGPQGIRCNTLSPGLIVTPAVGRATPEEMKAEIQSHSPMGRLGTPEDLAHAALFLASDESTYITGQTISVDGGQLAHLPHYAHTMRTGMRVTLQQKP